MLLAAVIAASLALEPMVRVEGESVCPTIEEVQAELVRLSSQDRKVAGEAPARAGGADIAILRVAAGRLHVELHRPDGGLVGEKDLELRSRCGELARAVAVVIRAWESQIRFDVAPQAAPVAATPPAEPACTPRPPDILPPPVAAGPAAPASPASPASPDTGTKASWKLELGLGALLMWPASRPGAELFLAIRKPETRWLGHLIVDASSWHSAALGAGTGKWMRSFAGLGGGYAWRGANLTAQLEAHLLGALTLASADGFGVGWAVQRKTTFEPGVSAGLRLLGPRRSSAGAWLAVESAVWPRRQSLSTTDQSGGVVDAVQLPRFELWLAIGGVFPGPL